MRAHVRGDGDGGLDGLIGCVVIVYPEVAFRFEREGHAAVLCEGVVHLCIPMDTRRSL